MQIHKQKSNSKFLIKETAMENQFIKIFNKLDDNNKNKMVIELQKRSTEQNKNKDYNYDPALWNTPYYAHKEEEYA